MQNLPELGEVRDTGEKYCGKPIAEVLFAEIFHPCVGHGTDLKSFTSALKKIQPKRLYKPHKAFIEESPPVTGDQREFRYKLQRSGDRVIRGKPTISYFFMDDAITHIYTLKQSWQSLTELLDGEKRGFDSQGDYNQANKLGFRTAKDYAKFKSTGARNLAQYREVKKFRVSTVSKLNEKKRQLHEKKLKEQDLQKTLKERGCKNIQELNSLKRTGCSHMKVFRELEKHKVQNYGQLLAIKALDTLPDNTVLTESEITKKMVGLHKGYDERNSWANKNHYLCMAKCGTRYPEKDVKYVMQGGVRKLQCTDCKGELTQSKYYIPVPTFNAREQLSKGMKTRTKKIGEWDEKKGDFIKGDPPGYKIEYQTVVIDGPNVAKTPDGVAKLDRILNAKKEVEKAGLKAIVVVSAATRHQIDDKKALEKMIRAGHIVEGPSGEDDDHYAINIAFKENAYLLSRDEHQDYKDKYPSKAAELDRRELKFTIYDDNKVVLGRPLGNIDIS